MRSYTSKLQILGFCMLLFVALCCLTSPVYVHTHSLELAIDEESIVEEIISVPPPIKVDEPKVQIKAIDPVMEPIADEVLDPEVAVEQEEPTVWRDDVPLSADLQSALLEICEQAGIDPLLALGLIDTESGFQVDIVSATGDYGLCQLNYRYFDPSMTPEENMAAGIGLLADNIARYGTVAAGLTAYNRGHDDGSRAYANAVLAKAYSWGYSGG